MSGPTPGPWEARGLSVFPNAETALAIATVVQHRKESRANARLIAAAPDLLDALIDLLYAIGGQESTDVWCKPARTDIWCKSARAAIAKATQP